MTSAAEAGSSSGIGLGSTTIHDTIHATCLVLREAGILIRGESGCGKSTLAARLLARSERSKRFSRLVGDDRIRLNAKAGRLVARPVPAIAGWLEIRGVGLVRVPYEPACVVRVVVDLTADEPSRLPDPPECETDLLGVTVPRLTTRLDRAELSLMWFMRRWRFRGRDDTMVTDL